MTDTAGAALLRRLGRVEYEPTEAAMRRFTESRDAGTPDEIWLCEHPPVYTLGIAGKPEHVLNPGAIPVLRTARGGQVTYHGPGQVVAYPLIDLARQSLHVKEYVYRLEDAVLRTLESLHVTGHRVPGAPGVYVRVDDPFGHARLEPGPPGEPFRGLAKIAALGVKISRHRTWHGVALNVAMDLKPFDGINPCGYAGLATTDLATLGIAADTELVAERLGHFLVARLAR